MGFADKVKQQETLETQEKPYENQSQTKAKYQYDNPDNMPVLARLIKIVIANELFDFYPPEKLYKLAQQVEKIDLKDVGQKHNINSTFANDLTSLSLYNIVLYIDDSGSMQNGSRIEDMQSIVQMIADIIATFDTDGIDVRFFNNTVEGNNIRTGDDIKKMMSQVTFNFGTPLGQELRNKIIKPFVMDKQMEKPICVIIMTDGESSETGENDVKSVIAKCAKYVETKYNTRKAVCYQFAQVGVDKKATDFLNQLDDDKNVGQFVDVTSDYEIESIQIKKNTGVDLSPQLYCIKLLQGAIDSTYDDIDESKK